MMVIKKKVIDHCHLTGKYRGPAHNKCNLYYRIPKFIPVKIHNLTGYDSHLFIKELGFDASQIDAIPNTEEKYISFSKKIGGMKLRFIDSFKFMPSSLDNLSKNLRKMPENELSKYPPKIRQMKYIKYLKSKFRETSLHFPDDKLDLITRKGVYPYDYMNSEDKYEETKLPPKDKFYNKLNECHITDEEYRHAQRVWKAFNIKNLGEYTDLYVRTDVLILTDVFENFRDVCLKTYKLDPDWYFTAPGLSWDAMLKMTNIKLDLLHDYDMILMLEKGLRGGVSQCCNRYGKANNKYMKNYDKSKESNYLMYLDANNLYGWAMSQYLPYGLFKWIKPKEIKIENILDCPDNSKKGYILEVDLKYPKELHDVHTDLPLCPENRIPENSNQDSFIYDIKTDDFYEDMKSMIDYFDTSDYHENNPYNMPRCNKKVLGKMKDENSGVIMEEFISRRVRAMRSNVTRHLVDTSGNRVENIAENISSQLFDKNGHVEWFSLALDESTDVSDTAQVLIYIRGVDKSYEVHEELFDMYSIHGTTTGRDIFKGVEMAINQKNLRWKNLKCITTGGGKNMSGKNKGVVALVSKAVENDGGSKPLVLHCIIHQQSLCGKCLDMSEVLKPVISTVNFIRSLGLNHRQFRQFIEEIGENDLPYHTAVRWVSCGKVLQRFFELRAVIEIFLNEKHRPLTELQNNAWLWKLAFYVDLTKHVNELNLRLQGENQHLPDLYTNIKSFRKKLKLFQSQLRSKCFSHFKTCEIFSHTTETEFPIDFAIETLSALKINFDTRFSDFDAIANQIKIFQNPFDTDIEILAPELQMEMIDLQ
ncbi:unnamed protein product [Larinioides sclopetarius]|uniref:DNA-directed DNA polymerase n=1 Tax=Larinioides sclopetarius TaxID=280406 RepID=A0AAV2A4Q5_9ARAC